MNCERVLRRGFQVAACVAGLLGVTGMGGVAGLAYLAGASPAAHAADYGAVLAGAQSEFWKAMEQGIAQAATERRVQIVVRSPLDDDPKTTSQNLQLKLVKWMIDSGQWCEDTSPAAGAGGVRRSPE
jgi:ribose transport system substrate-binding protein